MDFYKKMFHYDSDYDEKYKIYNELSAHLEFVNHTTPFDMIRENFSAIVGWENIKVSSVVSEANLPFEGKSIAEIAALRGNNDPADAALDLLVEENLAVGMINIIADCISQINSSNAFRTVT